MIDPVVLASEAILLLFKLVAIILAWIRELCAEESGADLSELISIKQYRDVND
jgi:hypothetical protein